MHNPFDKMRVYLSVKRAGMRHAGNGKTRLSSMSPVSRGMSGNLCLRLRVSETRLWMIVWPIHFKMSLTLKTLFKELILLAEQVIQYTAECSSRTLETSDRRASHTSCCPSHKLLTLLEEQPLRVRGFLWTLSLNLFLKTQRYF